ncbi:MAG: transglutaminase-like domain-containing protein, partial [Desulfobacteraceae bacterium]
MKSRARMSIAAAVVIMVVLVAGSGFGDSGGNAFEEWGIPETPPEDPFRYFGYLSGAGLDEIFSAVAGDVRYEPYRGIMRGAIGTARAGSGNSADQAMLLAAMLRARGYQVRFVRGELEGRNAEILLRGMYPARPPSTGDLGSGIEAFEPLLDSELKDIAKDHMWVELFQGESWLPLDPSFPRAKPGEAYASAVSHFDQPPPELFQRIIITMWERTEDADSRKLGVVEGNAAELGSATISLSVRRIPQAAAGDDGGPSSGTVEKLGGLGGALGGGSKSRPSPEDETAPPEIVGVKLRRCFIVDGERREIGSTLALEEDGADFIRREWLEFEFSAPGSELRIIERTLYPAGREAASGGPPEDRTYSINIIPGPVPLGWVRSEAARVRSSLDLPAMQERMERLAENTGDQADEAALEIGSMGEALGTAAGRLIALQFAAGSDALTRKTAEAHGIIPAWAVPRVVISSVET